MLKLALKALWAGFLSLIGFQRKDPQLTEARHAEQEAHYGETVFSQPERSRDAVIRDFRLHEHDQ